MLIAATVCFALTAVLFLAWGADRRLQARSLARLRRSLERRATPRTRERAA